FGRLKARAPDSLVVGPHYRHSWRDPGRTDSSSSNENWTTKLPLRHAKARILKTLAAGLPLSRSKASSPSSCVLEITQAG
ncbi:unnamed protein product, partial [Ixodes pacificus]